MYHLWSCHFTPRALRVPSRFDPAAINGHPPVHWMSRRSARTVASSSISGSKGFRQSYHSGMPYPGIGQFTVKCGFRCDRLGKLQGFVAFSARLGHIIDQADARGMLGRDQFAGQEHLHRVLARNVARERDH